MKTKNVQHAGLYCRLSRDDGSDGPSMSIENQKQLLLDYVAERGWNVHDIYVDDGLTGTNFDRPDFKRMKQDIEEGKLDCVITKDLSRLGRNFSQTGYYTEEFFPSRGVRYIAINDNIDTLTDDNDMAGFYHVMNEFYPKQVSRKVRQVKKAASKQGKFIGTYAPYGYKKDPKDKHQLIINEETAPIVRRIFAEFAAGENARCIADRLTREGILSPRFYYYKIMDRVPPPEVKNAWLSTSLYHILRSQVYIGHMAQGKRQGVSFKTKQRRVVPKEDWIVVHDTHEPLVTQEIWDKVQKRSHKNNPPVKRLYSTGKPSLFSGMLRCASCGANLAYSGYPRKTGEIVGRYRCQSHVSKGSAICSSHVVYENMLEEIIINDIQHYASLTEEERLHIAETLMNTKGNEDKQSGEKLRRRLEEIDHRQSVIANTFKKMYEDRVAGIVPDEMFRDMMEEFNVEKVALQKEQENIYAQLEEHRDVAQDLSAWLALVKKHETVSALKRPIALELIESVEVKETFPEGSKRHLEIWINYRFIGNIQEKTERNAPHGVPLGSIAS